MKITKIKTFLVDGVFRPWTFVKVETDQPGLVGWGDCTDWGLEVVERVDSARVTRLYDIDHMLIMEGDVIRTIGDRRDGLRRLCRTRVCAQGRGSASAAAGFCVV